MIANPRSPPCLRRVRTIGAIFMKFGRAPATMAIVFIAVAPDLKPSTSTSGRPCELIDELLRLTDVAPAGCTEDDRPDVGLPANVLQRLSRRNRAGSKDRHGYRPKPARRDHFLVCRDPAAHAKPDLVYVRANDRILDRKGVERIEQLWQIHGDEPGLGVVAVLHVLRKNTEGLVEPEAKQQVRNHILQKYDGSPQAVEHLHLGVDQQLGKTLQIFPRHRHAALEDGADCAILGKKPLQSPDHAVIRDRVGILIGIRHARVELKILVTPRIVPHVIAYVSDALMSRTHEYPDPLVIRRVQHIDDRSDVLKLY